MRILIACEESQTVCKAFRAKGHEAYSCDVIPCSGGHPEWHIQDDVLKHLDDGWDMMIAHQPCDYLANSGVRWLYEKPGRWQEMAKAAEFFNEVLNAKIPRKCCENPIQHKHARELIRKYDQLIQPYQYGEPYTKATCLWLDGLPPLVPTLIMGERYPAAHMEAPGINRKRNRSRTYQGIADAMANQWG